MKLYSLSYHPNKPCYVLTCKDTMVMLDCSLIPQTVLNFLPLPLVPSQRLSKLPNYAVKNHAEVQLDGELKECCGQIFVNSSPEFRPPLTKLIDFSEVDAILISNYTAMFGLPFITEGTGFQGVVYMTEPTLEIGKFYLMELVKYIERSPKPQLARQWKTVLQHLPPFFEGDLQPKSWKQLFNWPTIQSSLSKVKVVANDERLDIFGTLKVMPVSSGYCLGSSNWILSTDSEKIVYLNGSSTLTTHPRPMDQTHLKNADVLILSALTQTPSANPDVMLGELCINTTNTLKNNGSVLMPCYPSGVIYDLFECLSSHLESNGYGSVPMYFISPVSHISLEYSNILGEWLSQGKQTKIDIPEEPFPHADLVAKRRLLPFKHIYDDGFCNDMKQPCIVFCGHPSLRFGDSVYFMEIWGSNPHNTLIFTEPDFSFVKALAPFQPLAMRTVHCPIDTSLNFSQAMKLIKDLKPNSLALPECYTRPPPDLPDQKDFQVDDVPERKMLPMKYGQALTLPLKRKIVRVNVDANLVKKVTMTKRNNVVYGPLLGSLSNFNNEYKLTTLPVELEQCYQKGAHFNYGSLEVGLILKKLNEGGLGNYTVKREREATVIEFSKENAKIRVEKYNTEVCTRDLNEFRKKLQNILKQCLKEF